MPVVLGGHSLGGALALIGALELKRAGQNIAAVITFGAPQAGNEAFSREYAAEGLSARTVLFEAHGDSVPRLLRRWYYRLGSGLQSRFAGLLTPGTEVIPRAYAVTGNPWTFLAQPALSAREVKDAVKHILDARAQRAKEEEERKAKAGSPAGATDAAETPATSAAPTSTSQAPAPTPTSTPTQGTGATPPPQGTGSSGAQAGWVVGAILVMVLVLLTLWLFVRSKRSAHAIIERYALFLSTLSYQHIRALRAGEPAPGGRQAEPRQRRPVPLPALHSRRGLLHRQGQGRRPPCQTRARSRSRDLPVGAEEHHLIDLCSDWVPARSGRRHLAASPEFSRPLFR